MRHHVLILVGLLGLLACGGKKKASGDLSVSGAPIGRVEGQVRIVLTFSKPMVKPGDLNKPLSSPPLRAEPAIEGEARWTDETTLTLSPTKSLPRSTRFVVTAPAGTRALDGSELGDGNFFEFFTERLSGSLEVLGDATHASRLQVVRAAFNQEVALAELIKHCAYESKDKRVTLKLAPPGAETGDAPGALAPPPAANDGPAKRFALVPVSELAMDTDWKVSCSDKLRGVVGNLGAEEKLEAAFHTYGPLRFVKMDPTGLDIAPDEDLHLSFSFTNPPKEPYQISIKPKVPGFPERCYRVGQSEPGLSCAVALEAHTAYTISIDAKQQDVFGQTLGTPSTLEIRTSSARPALSAESGYFVAELSRPVIPTWTRNVEYLDVRVVEITPSNFHELQPRLSWWSSDSVDLRGTSLSAYTTRIKLGAQKGSWSQHAIDPADVVGHAAGPGMYYVEVDSGDVTRESYESSPKMLANFTDIGVVSKLSPSRGLVWATQLSTGKPLPDAQVSVRNQDGKVTWTGTTDASGIAILPGTSKLYGDQGGRARAEREDDDEGEGEDGGEEEESQSPGLRVYVQRGADWTMVNPTSSGGLSTWAYNVAVDRSTSTTKLRGFMHTDRGLYRAGETVHVKGLARLTKLGGPLSVPTGRKNVKVVIDGPQGKTFLETEAQLSGFGGFWFDVELPEDARLGDYEIRAELEEGTFTRAFTVEAYRPATFEVSGKAKDELVVGRGDLRGEIHAAYFYGSPLSSGDVSFTLHSRPRNVRFDAFRDFSFFDERRYQNSYYYGSQDSQSLITERHLALDSKGDAAFDLPLSPSDVSSDADLLIRADVTAPNNEVISKTFTVPYFRSRKYFGIKSEHYFLEVGQPQKVQLVAVTPNGKAAAGNAKVTVYRRDWNCTWEDWGYRGSYRCKEETTPIANQIVALAAGKSTPFEINPKTGGNYWIIVESDQPGEDASPAAVELYAWGDGGGSWQSSDSMAYTIVTDKKEYNAGDTAVLLLKTDLAQATGLVTIERDGVIEQRLIEVTPKAKHVQIPITDAHAPNVYVSVALVQGRMGEGQRGKPRMRMGVVNLPVRPTDSTLNVEVATDHPDYRPGAPVTAKVKVTDKAGRPVSAEVSLTAADEGVLSLINFQTPNPVPTFYSPWGLGVTSATQMEYLRDIPGPNVERPATGGDSPGTLRSRFVSTAVWRPGVVTDSQGVATVTFDAPDNLTAFRVMAVAADQGYRFGSGDKRFTVSKPLQLHQSLPRFLALGDQLHGGVIVHNETGQAGTATVKVVADEHLTVVGSAEQTVTLAKGAKVPVLFDLKAASVGQTALRFSVSMGAERDAVEFKLPVQYASPVLTQRVANGTTKQDQTIDLTLPPGALPDTAELVVSVDPDGLSGIEEGLSDLIEYPYGCLEQTTSRVIPMIAVRKLAESMSLAGLAGADLQRFVKAGVAKIGRHQTAYGGFSLWPGGQPEAYYTAYALWGLYLAREAGYQVDQARIDDGLEYLRGDGQRPDASEPYHNELGNLGSQAFALYIRAILGDKDPQAATALLAKPDLPRYGKAFLARALAASTSRKDPAVVKLVNELVEIANAATRSGQLIHEDSRLHGYMSSSLRSTAIVLAALVDLAPKHAAIPPLVAAIMKARRDLPYYDTQQNLYSLLALSAFSESRSTRAPSVEVQLADRTLLSGALSGQRRLAVATTPLTPGALVIKPSGELTYSVQIRYRATPASLKPASNGITLKREYLDEAGQPKTSFKVGDVVVVRVTGSVPSDREHLMFSEPLPAGFEALNTRLATVGDTGTKEEHPWNTYREMLDDRVNFATTWAYRSQVEYEFSMRATSVGTFARPPTVAELMYDPAVNARGALDVIEIKAK
ncbi:MAG: MG2 domain-containing protein [Kofleriaceae bacterium]